MWLGGNTNTSMVQASNFLCYEDNGSSGGVATGAAVGLAGGMLGAILIARRDKKQ
jgi:hypothetical protein